MERTSLYRKCRLEEVNLPLTSGNLRNVPMEEVRLYPNSKRPLIISQNIREEVAMDIDEEEDDDTFQRPRNVQDHGIEVDFSSVDDDDLAVCKFPFRSDAC
jgi:structural maintenance of chromosome 1